MSDTNGACGFIRDGYTRDGFIQGVDRWYPALRFTYRPALGKDRIVIAAERRKAEDRGDPARAETLAAGAMATRIVSWDLQDDRGETVEITAENILRIQPQLQALLYNVVMGYQPSDEDPASAEAEKQAGAEQGLAAAIAGTSEEEQAAKN